MKVQVGIPEPKSAVILVVTGILGRVRTQCITMCIDSRVVMFLAWPGLVWFLFLKRSITQTGILKKCLLSWPSLIAVSKKRYSSREWFGQRCGSYIMIRTTSCFTATLASIKQYWEYVCCLRPLQTGCLDLYWILQAGGDKVFPEYAIIYRRQYDKTKVRSCEVMQMGDSACILQGCFIPFPGISWLSRWIGLLLETGSFLYFVLDSATG